MRLSPLVLLLATAPLTAQTGGIIVHAGAMGQMAPTSYQLANQFEAGTGAMLRTDIFLGARVGIALEGSHTAMDLAANQPQVPRTLGVRSYPLTRSTATASVVVRAGADDRPHALFRAGAGGTWQRQAIDRRGMHGLVGLDAVLPMGAQMAAVVGTHAFIESRATGAQGTDILPGAHVGLRIRARTHCGPNDSRFMVQAPQEIVTVGQQIPVAIDAVHCGRPETVAFLLQGPGHFDAMRQVYHATAPGIAKVTVVSGESGQHATLRFDVIQPSVATLEVEIVPTAPRVDAAPAMHVPALTVLFDFESAAVTAAGREALQQLVPALQAAADMPIVITGHTDATGPTAFNAELAMRRAEAVARVLEAAQISVARMRLEGFGESRPVAPNTTREGRAANRRVEVRPGH